MSRRSPRSVVILFLLTALPLVSCGDESPTGTVPSGDSSYPAPTTPESLVAAVQAIYNDGRATTKDRLEAYADLLSPDDHPILPPFAHECATADSTVQESWGLEEELDRVGSLFGLEESGEIFSITLDIEHDPPRPVETDPDTQGWMKIPVSSVDFRIMFNPEDGLEITGGAAEFLTAPADGRWYIVVWREFDNRVREGSPQAIDTPFCSLGITP